MFWINIKSNFLFAILVQCSFSPYLSLSHSVCSLSLLCCRPRSLYLSIFTLSSLFLSFCILHIYSAVHSVGRICVFFHVILFKWSSCFFGLAWLCLNRRFPPFSWIPPVFFFCFLALALYFWFSPLPRVCVCVLLCSNWNVSGTRRATLWIFSCIYAVWKISSCVRCAVCVCAIIIYQQPAWKQARILRLSNICKCAHTHSRH